MFNNIHKGNAIRSLLKDSYLGPRCVLDVLVDGKDEHEGEEDPDAAKEVPDVVPDVNKGSPTHLIETQLTRGSGNLTCLISTKFNVHLINNMGLDCSINTFQHSTLLILQYFRNSHVS